MLCIPSRGPAHGLAWSGTVKTLWDWTNYFPCTLIFALPFCNHLFIGDFGCLPLGPVLGRAAPLGGGTTFGFGASAQDPWRRPWWQRRRDEWCCSAGRVAWPWPRHLEYFFAGCFPIVQDHMPGRASSLALAEAPRISLCMLFPYSAGP